MEPNVAREINDGTKLTFGSSVCIIRLEMAWIPGAYIRMVESRGEGLCLLNIETLFLGVVDNGANSEESTFRTATDLSHILVSFISVFAQTIRTMLWFRFIRNLFLVDDHNQVNELHSVLWNGLPRVDDVYVNFDEQSLSLVEYFNDLVGVSFRIEWLIQLGPV
jgi:hypothetical protein